MEKAREGKIQKNPAYLKFKKINWGVGGEKKQKKETKKSLGIFYF